MFENEFKDIDGNKESADLEKNTAEIDLNHVNTTSKNKKEVENALEDIVLEDVQEEEENKKKNNEPKSNKYKYLIYLGIILLITGLVLWYNLTRETVGVDGSSQLVYETIPDVAKNTNIGYFILFIFTIFFGFFLSALIIFLFARLYTKHYKMHQALANALIGSFYGSIVPTAGGSQLAQIYVFKKQGLPVSNAASIFVMSFIVYQVALILFGIIALLTNFMKILSINLVPIAIGDISFNIPIWIFIALGFLLNLAIIGVLFFMSLSTWFQNIICNGLINFLAKIKIIKNPEKTRKSLRIQVENYRIEFRRLQSNLGFTLVIFLIYCLSLINTQLQPFLCGLALNGFDPASIDTFGEVINKMFQSIAYSNFQQMATGLIPLPGGAGVSEIVFSSLYGPTSGYFSEEFYAMGGINIVLLLWRFMTFYIPFIINGIVAATYKSRGIPMKERIVPVGDRRTMLTLQLETYAERKETSDIAYQTSVMERKEFIEKVKRLTKKDPNKKTGKINLDKVKTNKKDGKEEKEEENK